MLAANLLESVIFMVVIMTISAISNWLKRRNEQTNHTPPAPVQPPEATGQGSPAPRPVRQAPRPISDWEAELRRLLEGETAPPPTPPPPPPLPAQPRTAPAPATSPTRAPSNPPVIHTGLPVPTERGVEFPSKREALDDAPAPAFQLAPMQQSAAAYLRGSTVDAEATLRVEDAARQAANAVPTPVRPHHRQFSPEAAFVIAQLRNPRTTRQVVIASLILAPPKALES